MGEERFQRYLKSFDEDVPVSIRLNPLKVDTSEWTVVGGEPVPAVEKQHIGALRFRHVHAFEMRLDILYCKIYIAGQNAPEFVHPLHSRIAVRADEGVHGQNIHGVVNA